MPKFSKTSADRLRTCDFRLQFLFNRVVKNIDCTIIEGHRDEETQKKYFNQGKSRVQFPDGKHNSYPSQAVDVAPFINGSLSFDMRHCLFFAGYVLGIAQEQGIVLRWGGDWDMDGEAITDQNFQDLVHFELV